MRSLVSRSLTSLAVALVLTSTVAGAQTADAKPQSKEKKAAEWVCKDGTKATDAGAKTCAGHRGVDSVASKAAKQTAKAEKAEVKAEKAKLEKNPQKAAKADAKAKSEQAKADKAEDKAAKDSAGATAVCKDGTYSHAKSTKGACSRHGGIAKTLKTTG